MKMPKSTWLPAVLAIYLAVMAYIGLDGLRTGQTSLTFYIIVLVICVAVLAGLHFNLKKREKLRREREQDIENTNENPK